MLSNNSLVCPLSTNFHGGQRGHDHALLKVCLGALYQFNVILNHVLALVPLSTFPYGLKIGYPLKTNEAWVCINLETYLSKTYTKYSSLAGF